MPFNRILKSKDTQTENPLLLPKHIYTTWIHKGFYIFISINISLLVRLTGNALDIMWPVVKLVPLATNSQNCTNETKYSINYMLKLHYPNFNILSSLK